VVFGMRTTGLTDGNFYLIYGNTNMLVNNPGSATREANQTPAQAGQISDFTCSVETPPLFGDWNIDLQHDTASLGVCIIGGLDRTCKVSGSFATVLGDLISLHVTKSFFPAPSGNASCTIAFAPTSP